MISLAALIMDVQVALEDVHTILHAKKLVQIGFDDG
jgi:hypothetical protein